MLARPLCALKTKSGHAEGGAERNKMEYLLSRSR